jgi:prepilin-type N-terminal cleavage/methylation domain-containing protein
MKHRQSGFSVIEMMISLVLSAMLMTISLTIYNQISKGAGNIQRITQNDTQVMILHNRLSADLAGLCPLWFTQEHYEKLKKAKEPKDVQENAKSIPTNNSSSKKRNNFLYAQSNGAQFDLLTFVTTNALQVYGDKPRRTVRIVYLLQPEGHGLTTFKLMRKEDDTISGDFDLEKLKTGKFDQIAHKITECKIEYGFIETTSKKPDSAQTSAPKSVNLFQNGVVPQNQKKKMKKLPRCPTF